MGRLSTTECTYLPTSYSARESQALLSIHFTVIGGCVPVRTLKWLYNSKKKKHYPSC